MKRRFVVFAGLASATLLALTGLMFNAYAAADVDNSSGTAACTPNCNNSATGWYVHAVTVTTPPASPPPAPPAPPPVITYKADTAKKTAFTTVTHSGICEDETQTWYVTPWAEYSNGVKVRDQTASAALINEENWEKSAHVALTGTWYDSPPSNNGGANVTGQLTYSDKTSAHPPSGNLQCP
jgi:hypothetical protein